MLQRYWNPQKMSPVEEKLVRSNNCVCLKGSESSLLYLCLVWQISPLCLHVSTDYFSPFLLSLPPAKVLHSSEMGWSVVRGKNGNLNHGLLISLFSFSFPQAYSPRALATVFAAQSTHLFRDEADIYFTSASLFFSVAEGHHTVLCMLACSSGGSQTYSNQRSRGSSSDTLHLEHHACWL